MLPYTVWSLNCYPQFSFSHTCFFPCYFTCLLGFLILSNFSFNFMNNSIRSPKYLWSQSHFISLYFFTALFPSLEGCDAFPCFFLSRLHIPDIVWWRQSIRHLPGISVVRPFSDLLVTEFRCKIRFHDD